MTRHSILQLVEAKLLSTEMAGRMLDAKRRVEKRIGNNPTPEQAFGACRRGELAVTTFCQWFQAYTQFQAAAEEYAAIQRANAQLTQDLNTAIATAGA